MQNVKAQEIFSIDQDALAILPYDFQIYDTNFIAKSW